MKKNLLFFFLVATTTGARAQQWLGNYPYVAKETNNDHIGLYGELGVNSSSGFVHRNGYSATAKGALSMVPRIGVYFQKSLGDRFSIRGGFGFGQSSFAYKYAPAYDSMGADQNAYATGKAKYVKVKHPSAFVQPHIDIGYLFGPIKKMYVIELRAGVGMAMYLGKSTDSSTVAKGVIRYHGSNVGNLEYFSTEWAKYGQPKSWGFMTADIYLGLRWKNTNSPILNRSGLGIQVSLPVSTSDAGYSTIDYKEQRQYYYIGQDKVDMTLMTIGIRYSLNIL